MTTVFLCTFFIGFGLTVISALLGAIDASGAGLHGDSGGLHAGDGGLHMDPGGLHAGDGGGGHAGHLDHAHGHAATVSPMNFQSAVAFLMGFGGVGYLATAVGVPGLLLILALAAGGGLAAAWLILSWLRFLIRGERPLEPTSYEGTVGRLTVGIRQGGTGEILYTDHGTRTVLAARSSDGGPIPRGTQVVILRYARGVAYVQPLQDRAEEKGGV